MKKIKLAAAVLSCSVFMSGCSFGGSVDSLLSAPKLSEEQNAVYDALIKSVGKDIRLKYPRSGEYRSAFVFADIDGEPDREAVVFYEKTGETEGGGNVRINVIDRRGGKWTSVYDHAGAGTGIDRIIFAELGESGRQNVIIGYTLLSGERSVQIYGYENGLLNTEYSDSYSTMFSADLERDGNNELILIRPGNQMRKASLSSVSTDLESGSIAETGSVALDESATEFVSVAAGYVGKETPAIFIDGLSGGQLTTEIIYSVDGQLRNPLYLGESGLIERTRRPAGYLCTDIDLDGVIEIPTLTLFPGYSEDSSGTKLYSTDWNVFDNYSITKKYSSFYNVSEGYCFILPSRWDGVVTVKRDSATGEAVFCKFKADLANSTVELLRIAVASEEETGALLDEGYMVLKSNNKTNYLVKCPDLTDEPLTLTGTEIGNSLYLMA
ncbi:MAG: hypothetical protein K2N60_04930 [Oscillospiraceae bacterium]|nr:hypothetical protein [Oscillospiraceae bacterium]